MLRQGLIIAGFGVLLGLFFIAGRWTASGGTISNDDTPVNREKALKAVQDELKYTYYSELLKRPSDEPPEAVSSEAEVSVPVSPMQPPPAPLPVEKPSPDRMAQALAKVLGNETPDSVKSVIKESLPAGTGSPYAIQVASLPSRSAGEELVKRLQKKGHAAKLVQAEIPGKGSMYRVRIHGFKTREEADKYREEKQIEGITVGQ
ncbi:MAG: SPOR domain-containing protein [Myxococcota bacterium]